MENGENCFQTHEETREKNWVIQVRIEQNQLPCIYVYCALPSLFINILELIKGFDMLIQMISIATLSYILGYQKIFPNFWQNPTECVFNNPLIESMESGSLEASCSYAQKLMIHISKTFLYLKGW